MPIHDHASELPDDLLESCRPQPRPARVLMCTPDEFDVIDVKNPHMEGNIGNVDRALAGRQWREVRAAFEDSETSVDLIEPVPGCEDMVFCANQTLVGLDARGNRLCLLSRMRHASRQREVPAFGRWFESAGYRTRSLEKNTLFEGSGDAIWHPGRGLIWGGCGTRTEPESYEAVSTAFDVPVIRLELCSERFYHLDTCFCALDEHTVLIDPESLTPPGVEMIETIFDRVLRAPRHEADQGMACNATSLPGGHVVIQSGNETTTGMLRECGFTVHEVDTGEFMKSGGSVFCMKMFVF